MHEQLPTWFAAIATPLLWAAAAYINWIIPSNKRKADQ